MVDSIVTDNIRENIRKFANTKHLDYSLKVNVNGNRCNRIVVK